ncbi:MAG: Ig domain-containing protein [Acidobacteriota bacterium]
MTSIPKVLACVAIVGSANLASAATNWRQGPSAPAGLGVRFMHGVALDTARNRVVLFGGWTSGSTRKNDTWEWDGTSWIQGPAAPAGLTPRVAFGMAFDSTRNRVVIFGGWLGAAFNNETWEYDGSAWTPGPAPPAGLTPRGFLSICYDSLRQHTVLFGGAESSAKDNDTWVYDGAGWTAGPTAPAGLTARSNAAIAFDPTRGLTVLFGGTAAGQQNDTWLFDGASWVAGPSAPVGLTPRAASSMAFDRSTGVLVMFGGLEGSTTYDETWLFDGTAWTAGPAAPTGLSARAYAGVAADVGGGVLLQGGLAGTLGFDDTWEYVDSCSGLSLGPATLPGGTAGVPYSQTLTAFGGSAPYTFSVTAGALPPGLTLAASGTLSGTPTSPGVYSFTVTVTDASTCSTSLPYTVAIGPIGDYLVGEGLGPSNPNQVRIYTASGQATATAFLAYGAGQWGVNVAGGDIDGIAATPEIITGPGPGAVYGPQVRGFQASGSAMGKVNFFAYGTLRYGVNVAAGQIDADGYEEIVSGPGPGTVFGPHVRGWDFDGTGIASIAKISFFAYGTLRYGVNVVLGDADGDGFEEILTGAGPGNVFASTVRGWNYDGTSIASIAKINFNAFAYPGYGVNVATGDVDADGFAEILATPGPGATHPSRFLGFDYDGNAVAALPGFDVTAFGTTFGGRVGGGDITGDGKGELITGAGRDAAAASFVKAYDYGGSTLVQAPGQFEAFPGSTYGVNATIGNFGF